MNEKPTQYKGNGFPTLHHKKIQNNVNLKCVRCNYKLTETWEYIFVTSV